MKRLSLVAAVIVALFSAPYAYAAFGDAFLSRQVGSSPSNGRILQTDGTNSTWATASGIGLPYYASTTIGGGTQTTGLTIFGNATTTGSMLAGNGATAPGYKVQGSGWVGIKNTTPAASGFIFSDYEPFAEYGLYYNNSSDIWSFTSGNGNVNTLGNFTITNETGNSRTAYIKASFDAAGNVLANTTLSVGTTSPWGILSVNPTSALGSVPSFVIGSSNRTHFIVNNAGTVGIGTTTPHGMLSVNPNGIGSAPAFVIGSSTQTIFSVSNAGAVVAAREISNQGNFNISASGNFRTGNYFQGANNINRLYLDDTFLGSGTLGTATFFNSTATSFAMLSFGGSSASFPGFRINTATQAISVTNADGSLGGRFGVGTSTPFSKLAVHLNNGETNTTAFIIASSTASATTTLMAVRNNGAVAIASTTPTSPGAILTLGENPDSTNGTSTIMMGKVQFDGYNSAGARICTYIVGTTPVTSLGACNQ